MTNCNYCYQSILFGGKNINNKLFCSDNCINEYEAEKHYLGQLRKSGKKHAEEAFCKKCLNSTIEEPFRGTVSINGVGTKLVGNSKERCNECGSVIKSIFPSMGFESLPLKSYRMIKTKRDEYTGRAFRTPYKGHKRNVLKYLVLFLIIFIGGVALALHLVFSSITSSIGTQQEIVEMVKQSSYNQKLQKIENGNFVEVLDNLPEISRDYKDEFLRGYALYGLHRQKESWKCLKKSMKMNPDYPMPVFLCGKIMEDRKNYKRAKKFYKKAIQISPDYTPAIDALKRLK